MRIHKKQKIALKQELKDYEKTIPMTKKERKALRAWVKLGYSVHDNDARIEYEDGRPLDFLDVYREEEKIRFALKSMTYGEGSAYLLEEYGIDRGTIHKPLAYSALKEKADRLYRTCFLYWEFIVANDLKEEACEYISEHANEALPFDSLAL